MRAITRPATFERLADSRYTAGAPRSDEWLTDRTGSLVRDSVRRSRHACRFLLSIADLGTVIRAPAGCARAVRILVQRPPLVTVGVARRAPGVHRVDDLAIRVAQVGDMRVVLPDGSLQAGVQDQVAGARELVLPFPL